ncbi:MAG: SIMPL domain-containing protein [Candidatus Niyogibacteria bacterium]|nr:SIMPL domain-containing protein [Candidatus Niyogibacteria bacterium]
MFNCNCGDKNCAKCGAGRGFLLGGVALFVFMLTVFVAVKTVAEVKTMKRAGAQVNTISVTGEGKVLAKPDIGQVSLAVVQSAATVEAAQSAATKAMNDIMKFLKDSGVAEKDIKTTEYSVYPLYDYSDGKRMARGYEVRQGLTVKIRELADAGKIVAGSAERGANQVGGITFTTEDPTLIKEEARRKAIADAKQKAKVLARDLGVSLGDIVSFNESGGGYPIFYAKAMGGAERGGDAAPVPDIAPGENETAVNVTITFEIQ